MALSKEDYELPSVEDGYFETISEMITKNLSYRRYKLAYERYDEMWTAYLAAGVGAGADYTSTIGLARTTKEALLGAIDAYEHHVVAKAALNVLFAFVRNNSSIAAFDTLYTEFCSEL